MVHETNKGNVQMNEQHYRDAVTIAKNELDSILPEFNRLQERVTSLRMFIVYGTKLSEGDTDDLNDKYKLPSMVRRDMIFTGKSNQQRILHKK
jgi:hypothetical protein